MKHKTPEQFKCTADRTARQGTFGGSVSHEFNGLTSDRNKEDKTMWKSQNSMALVPHHTSRDVKSYKIIWDLKNMKDGWDGPDSFAPSPDVISALIEVFTILNWEEEDIKPIEVDGNGSLVMIWKSDGNVYSVDINRDARAVFTITDTSKKKSKSITLDSSKHTEVEEFIEPFRNTQNFPMRL